MIQLLDKIKKKLELDMIPQAIEEIGAILLTLEVQESKKKGKIFIPIHIPQTTETERENPLLMRDFEMANKINEIINWLNTRFSY